MVGLVTRNADNKITADMTKSLSQSAGFVDTDVVAGSGSKVISLPDGRNYFYIIRPLEDSQRTKGKSPGVTLTKDLISWEYRIPNGFAMKCRIYYGYY